jgi:hypothetical protein
VPLLHAPEAACRLMQTAVLLLLLLLLPHPC